MKESPLYDLVIIGSGPGGYAAALQAAHHGMRVAIIEARATHGGTCLNVGCIPSKALLQATERLHWLQKQGTSFGIMHSKLGCDLPELTKKKDQVVSQLTGSIASLFKVNKIDAFHGTAKLNKHAGNGAAEASVIVTPQKKGEKPFELTGKNLLLAAGSQPIELKQAPFDEKTILSSTGALNLSILPKKLVVVGAGVIGLELASVYRRLGSEVVILELLERLSPGIESSIAHVLLQSLKKQGLQFHFGTMVTAVSRQKDRCLAINSTITEGGTPRQEQFTADALLVAIGRKPASHSLGLEEVAIATDPRGFISVDDHFATTVRGVYAIGDLIHGPMLAHRATEEAIVLVDALAGHPHPINYLTIPNVIYTDPEVATVGATEEEALAAGYQVIVGEASYRGNPRARVMGEAEGVVRLIGEETSGRLLGMHIVAPHASELISLGVLAIDQEVTIDTLARVPYAHPSLSEAIKEAAMGMRGRPLHS